MTDFVDFIRRKPCPSPCGCSGGYGKIYCFSLSPQRGLCTDSEEPFTGAVLLLPPWVPAAAGPVREASD